MHRFFRFLNAGSLAALMWMAATSAQAQVDIRASIGTASAPGIYGRIDIGQTLPPPLLYAQPVVIQRPALIVQQDPLYLYVPREHAKHWRKHCRQYQACGQPVYFVRDRPQHVQWHGDDKHHQKNQKKYAKDQEKAYKQHVKAHEREVKNREKEHDRREKERERAYKRYAKQQDRRDDN